MRISDVKVVLRRLVAINEPVLLIGHAGVGKTQIVRQIGEELNRPVKTVILSQLEPGDLIGLPVSVGGRTEFLRPSWLPSEDEENVILFLDELNRAPLYVRQGILQLVQEKQIGPHTLPKSLSIVAAMNPDMEGYQVNDLSDRALLSRFVVITVQNSAEDLACYLRAKGYTDEEIMPAIDVLEKRGIFSEDIPMPKLDCNPRTIERALRVMRCIADLSQELQYEVLSGIMGMAAADFIRNISGKQLKVEDFLEGRVEKIAEYPLTERITVMLRIIQEGLLEKVPQKVLDALSDEDWASILRNMKKEPSKYFDGFMQLRKVYPRAFEVA